MITECTLIDVVNGWEVAVEIAVGATSLSDIRDSPGFRAMYGRILREVVALARAECVPLGDGVVDQRRDFAATPPPGSVSSLHNDLVAGRRMELEALHGEVVRRAAQRRPGAPANG